jgi:hypothetical protein
MVIAKEISSCRICGSKALIRILSLGNQCVTNFLDNSNEEVYKAPLELVLCDPKSGGCGLLQLKHTFDHDLLYKKYWYQSGISTTMVRALSNIVESAEDIVVLKPNDIVLDIGSNDGTLLKQYKNNGIIRIGFEPSNLWQISNNDGIEVIHNYFNSADFNSRFPYKKAKIITSIAMFYDLENPSLFVENIKECLDSDGLWIIQMNYLGLMLENNTFDNISHEHLEYYSLGTLEYLLKAHNLSVKDVLLNDVNGGSFRIYVTHSSSKLRFPEGSESRITAQREYERSAGFNNPESYHKFAERIKNIKNQLLQFLNSEKNNGKISYIYGASTRGLVLLQFCGIDNKLIKFATDKNSEKWGKYIAGTGIKILPIDEYRKNKPDYLLVLPYQFIDEIAEQEANFLDDGGKLLIAIPSLKIISK